MAAANTDKLKKLSRRWVGQIGAGGVADAVVTTIPLASTTNLPTDTAVVATINRVDANGEAIPALEETVIGIVSGSNLTDCVRGVEGTAQAHDAGDVVEILVTAKGWNDLVDHLLVQHDQAGRHTNVTASNISSSAVITACTIDFNAAGTNSSIIRDASDNELVKFTQTASAVNEITIANAATNNAPSITASGGDTNTNLKLKPKGTGIIIADGPVNYAADGGANDTYAITASGISAYVTGLHIRFKANTANTGAATLNVNALGAITIKKQHDQDLATNDIESGQIVDLVYDGTNFQMQSQLAASSSAVSIKVGTFTRDLAAAAGSVATTGVGFTPRLVQFFYSSPNGSSKYFTGEGAMTASNQWARVTAQEAAYKVSDVSASHAIYITNASGTNQQAAYTSFDSDGFTLEWTKAGSPSDTITISYIAFS